MSRRKAKKGYVYLLKSIECNDGFNDEVYKYGCTTLTPDKRCKAINAQYKEYKFISIACFKSFDIYRDEGRVRQYIVSSGIGMLSEIFSDIDDRGEEGLITHFLSIGGCIIKRKGFGNGC